jgi:hypothetical protein
VFSLIASTGGVERVNSNMGFVQSKLRSCLGDNKVNKLVYIKSNHNLLADSDKTLMDEIREEEANLEDYDSNNGASSSSSSSSSSAVIDMTTGDCDSDN